MRARFFVGAMILVFTSAGCTRDLGFDFSQGGERVLVRVKLQEDLKLRPMKAIYRSRVCTGTDYNSNWEPYQRDGYNNIVKHAEPSEQKDMYSATFEINGGGSCQWQLSNITFGVQYKNPERFGSGVLVAGAGLVVVAFDDNRPQQGGGGIVVPGNLDITEDYYLWVADRKGERPRVKVGLLAEDNILLSYKASAARVIKFEPRLHSDYIAYSSSSREEGGKGYKVIFTYPGGSVVDDGRIRPDFKRLQCIRLPDQCKK